MRFLLLSQVFPPDPTAVGQHFAEFAEELVRRGHEVTVLTANRGYDDPSLRFAAREDRGGLRIRRLPASSFGKRSLATRAAGMVSFLAQAFVRGLFGRHDAVLVSTSPPAAASVAAALSWIRGLPFLFWVMDLNPDQAVAAGRLRPGSPLVRLLGAAVRRALRRAALVVTLDRPMAERVAAKVGDLGDRLRILPPWAPLPPDPAPPEPSANAFRAREGIDPGRFVVMYSGNHSPVHPLDTILAAAVALREDDRFAFLFVGGGAGRPAVAEFVTRHGLGHRVRLLPYEPLSGLRESLAAADVHVVSMGDAMVGVLHPSKAYGAFAVGRPILVTGPATSHFTELLAASGAGWRHDHGDVAGVVARLRALADDPAPARAAGAAGRDYLRRTMDPGTLCARLADWTESALASRP